MSSKPLAPTCYPFITLLCRDICDKMEQREVENEALWKASAALPIVCYLHLPCSTWDFHLASRGVVDAPSGVSDAPWQAGRPRDRLMSIIEGKKKKGLLNVWRDSGREYKCYYGEDK